MWSPAAATVSIRTRSPPSSGDVDSTITIASAPSGSAAPVMMRTACPRPTRTPAGSEPAANVATTSKVTGAPAVSAARSAKPSIAVLSNGGTGSPAATGSASTRPAASSTGTRTAGRRRTVASTWARASSSGITAAPSHEAFALDEVHEIRTQPGTEVVASSCELDVGAEVVELVPGVETSFAERVAVDARFIEQECDGVGQLDLAADAGLYARDRVEDVGREHVATHHRKIRWREISRRLLDDLPDADQLTVGRLDPGAAVCRGIVDLHQGDDTALDPLCLGDHRFEQQDPLVDEIV